MFSADVHQRDVFKLEAAYDGIINGVKSAMSERNRTSKLSSHVSHQLHPHTCKSWLRMRQCPLCGRLSVFEHCVCNVRQVFDDIEWYSTWSKLHQLHDAKVGPVSSAVDTEGTRSLLRPKLSTLSSVLYTTGVHHTRTRKSSRVKGVSHHVFPSGKESQVSSLCSCYICVLYRAKTCTPSRRDCIFTVLTPCASCGSAVLCPCRERSCDLTVKQLTPTTFRSRVYVGYRLCSGATVQSQSYWVAHHTKRKQRASRVPVTGPRHKCFPSSMCPSSSYCRCRLWVSNLGDNLADTFAENAVIQHQSVLSRISTVLATLGCAISCPRRGAPPSSRSDCRSANCPCLDWLLQSQWCHAHMEQLQTHLVHDVNANSSVVRCRARGALSHHDSGEKVSSIQHQQGDAWSRSKEHTFHFSTQKFAVTGTKPRPIPRPLVSP